MYNRDSLDKVEEYLKELEKPILVVLPSFFQHYGCPENCGGCCLNFTKDFLEGEFLTLFRWKYPDESKKFKLRKKNNLSVYTYSQKENSIWCDFFKGGKCSIHDFNPFSCSFELNKIRVMEEIDLPLKYTNIGKAFYRDKSMTTFEGKPLKCSFGKYTKEDHLRDIATFERLKCYQAVSKKKDLNLEAFIYYLRCFDIEKNEIPTENLYFYKGKRWNYDDLRFLKNESNIEFLGL